MTAVAGGELDGQPIAVFASADRTLRVWELHSGCQHAAVIGREIAHEGPSPSSINALVHIRNVIEHSKEPLDGPVDRRLASPRGAPPSAFSTS
ncbi:MAG: hypothetical protein LC790_01860, partial [Actinobacteria bacterium]|nr:hypothetical protein [Actinomycetota bacterium]